MALVQCPDCGRQVSDTAPACPGCGRPGWRPPASPVVAPPRSPTGIRAQRRSIIAAAVGVTFAVVVAVAWYIRSARADELQLQRIFLAENCPATKWDEQAARDLVAKCEAKRKAAAPAPLNAAPAAVPAAAVPASAAKACDADALWFDGGAGDANGFEAVLHTWSPECRQEALRTECAHSCDEVISDRIIAASGTPEEKGEAFRARMELNIAALSNARDFLRRAREIQHYALSIRGTPRSIDPACMSRMRDDFARIDVLVADAKTLPIPLGGMSISLFAGSAKTCVSCGDDLASECNDMAEPLKDMSDNLADLDKLVAHDKKAIGTK